LGACARILQQAGTRRRGRKPGFRARKLEMFRAVDAILRENDEVGAYNQSI
jgi:hypothetical protein